MRHGKNTHIHTHTHIHIYNFSLPHNQQERDRNTERERERGGGVHYIRIWRYTFLSSLQKLFFFFFLFFFTSFSFFFFFSSFLLATSTSSSPLTWPTQKLSPPSSSHYSASTLSLSSWTTSKLCSVVTCMTSIARWMQACIDVCRYERMPMLALIYTRIFGLS